MPALSQWYNLKDAAAAHAFDAGVQEKTKGLRDLHKIGHLKV